MSNEMELKAYKMLAQIRGSMLSSIRQRAMNKVEYGKIEKPEELTDLYEYIANPDKWEYCGLLSKEQKAILETLEYLLNDDQKEPFKYKEWKPLK